MAGRAPGGASGGSDSQEGSTGNGGLESRLTRTVLTLEEVDKNLYRANNLWKSQGARGAFGGQMIGLALVAAGKTTPKDVHIHSMHSYFLKPGDVSMPAVFHVRPTLDGNSFCSRSVQANQKGVPIFTAQVSYHKHEESHMDYQSQMPNVPPPEDLKSVREHYEDLLSRDDVSEKVKVEISSRIAQEIPYEIKPVEVDAFFSRYIDYKREPNKMFWIRATGNIGPDTNLHRCVAAYLSDLTLLFTAMLPHPDQRPSFMASLDHSMWFHSHFRADDWMLYECHGQRSVGNRSLVSARMWTRDGTLAVSLAQEGVIRTVPKKSTPKAKL